jgi:hypothetical protein
MDGPGIARPGPMASGMGKGRYLHSQLGSLGFEVSDGLSCPMSEAS